MRPAGKIIALAVLAALGIFAGSRSACQDVLPNSLLEPAKNTQLTTLKISLRLPNESAFEGAAHVTVTPELGLELFGGPGSAPGEFLFSAVAPGNYTVEVSAPGYLTARLSLLVEAGGGEKTVFVVMRPKEAKAEQVRTEKKAVEPEIKLKAQSTTGTAEVWRWQAHELNKLVPSVDPSVACPLQEVLHGVGQRMKEFVASMEKFTATETLEHYTFDKSGELKEPEKRSFAYVVTVTRAFDGEFMFDEFRNGTQDRTLFPANLATLGLPAVGLVFHPQFAGQFEFQCEGLGQWEGREMWQVHFTQRKVGLVRVETYSVNGRSFAVRLEGRAWIEPGNLQLAGMESELMQPIPEIRLMEQNQKIRYAPVHFTSTGQEIWLPQEAEMYVERNGKRFYRRHAFSDFRLFNVDTSQKQQAPKGSYSFTNMTDRDLPCELMVEPVEGLKGGPVILRFTLPAHAKVFKVVGPGKDVNLPIAEVGSAKFLYGGEEGSVKVDVNLAKQTTLDVMPEGVDGTQKMENRN